MRFSASVIDNHFSNITNNDIFPNRYSENAKSVSVRPIFKNDDRTKMKKYRPVRFLNKYSEIYERHVHENLRIT